ncbi:Prolyl 4-hydroxylase, alpha subunit [Psychromonas ingrahamii 37]|uniref:Prolyl 4-hydroxylase, alpha subunit n=1 Tax=Psychromonas ingrahamii (strain DSM 17664 / CCUG 51855 / 37) TaxID=357804 RepID=A1SY08_PSYIN|nr:2OG-Fe(II) oxygenase [Psychromonas ingrahamii]ABM04373.1 Prolyl 4-hydroxylase, alpha subunit [Psychromonas ingrahamii 37]
MEEATKNTYQKLSQLSSSQLNLGLLAGLEVKLSKVPNDLDLLRLQLELLKKAGLLNEAFATQQKLASLSGHFISDDMIKAAQKLSSVTKYFNVDEIKPNNFSNTPLVVIDDFLSPAFLSDLLSHTLENENKFRMANVGSDNPYYVPDKRLTHVSFELGEFKAHFLDFVGNNLNHFKTLLNIPDFNYAKSEIKLTNHLNGGFFQPHADNKAMFGDTKRVISWLYYYHQVPKAFKGGELLAFDSNIQQQEYYTHKFTKIEPINNRFVAFPSCFYHAVTPTLLADNQFSNGRMAVAGHIRFE